MLLKRLSLVWLFSMMAMTSQAQLVLERDINQEAASSDPYYVAELNGVLYLGADDGIHGTELYQFDMTSNTASLVANVRPFEEGNNISQVIAFDNRVFFSARDGSGSKPYLYVHDPIAQTTERLRDTNFQDVKEPFNFTVFNGQLFFTSDFSGIGNELGKYDPVANEISIIADINPTGSSFVNFFNEYNGQLWFAANDGQSDSRLWRYDPVTDTVENVIYNSAGAVFPSISFLSEIDGIFYFQGYTQPTGEEMWAYDPVSNDLLIIPELYPGIASSSPFGFTGINGKVYFSGRTASEGRELREYDPVTNQISLTADIHPTSSSNPSEPIVINDVLYVTASVDDLERRLFSYDPAGPGLTELATLDNGLNPNYLSPVLASGNRIFLSAAVTATGTELYEYTIGGSAITLAADINQTTIGSDPYGFTPYQGKLYFGADEANSGREIWVYDPATGNVEILSDAPGSTKPYNLAGLDDKLFFTGLAQPVGYGLYYYDLVTEQVVATSYITPSQIGHITDVIAYNDLLYLSVDDMTYGQEIFAYDPATDQASLAFDINPNGDSNPERFVLYEGSLYFQADDDVHGTELWRYNDIAGQPEIVKDLNPGSSGSGPDWFAIYDGELYFNAFVTGESNELFSYSSQTDSITQRTDFSSSLNPEYLAVYQDQLYFSGRFSSSVSVELISYDATTDTAVLIGDLNPGASNPRDLVAFNDKLYFSAFTDDYGRELWQLEDTSLSIVTDIYPGVPDAEPTEMTLFNGKLYFAANDGLRGGELWSMAECLNLIVDAEPQVGPAGSGSIDLTIQGGLPPYTISWSNGDTTEDLTGLMPGIYTATVADSSGCLSTISAEVLLVNSLAGVAETIGLRLFPNPSSTDVTVSVSAARIESVALMDLQGRIISQQFPAGRPAEAIMRIPEIPAGVYLILVETNEGSAVVKFVRE